MRRRVLVGAGVAVLAAWLAVGAVVRVQRAPRVESPAGEVRGAWHVHTTRSDGRGSIDEVVAEARAAGLQFVVVTDHNALTPEEQGWRDGVLVVQATEASTPFGHVVGLGVPRALTPEERERDPLGSIDALGGWAVLAHPLHPRRPFTGWGRGPWRGMEILSNDTAWGEVVSRRQWGRVALAAAVLPFDRARAVLSLEDGSADERRRFDDEQRAARRAEPATAPRVLLCSADAHGYPGYVAAFEAFSMHLPVVLTGDAAADVPAVVAALTDGRAACVLDAVAPATGVRFGRAGRGLELRVTSPDLRPARFALLRDGERVAERAVEVRGGAAAVPFDCGGTPCPPGDYRVEATYDGRPWIFTNPVRIE